MGTCRPLTLDEYHATRRAFRGEFELRNRALFDCQTSWGTRISETLSRNLDDVLDFSQEPPALRRAIWIAPSEQKGGGGVRRPALSPTTADDLRAWRRKATLAAESLPAFLAEELGAILDRAVLTLCKAKSPKVDGRRVGLSPLAEASLRAYLNTREVVGVTQRDEMSAPLFLNQRGGRLDRFGAARAYKAAYCAARIPSLGYTLATHNSRKTYAQLLLERLEQARTSGESSGAVLRTLMTKTGHRQVDSLIRYLRIDESAGDRALEAVHEAMGAAA